MSNVAEAVQTTVAHAAQAHGADELPNFLTVLSHYFPHSHVVQFFHRWENVVFSCLVLGLIAVRALQAAGKKEFLPKGIQNRWELVVEGITAFVTGILGPKGIEHVPFLGTLFLFILIENWLGLVPLMKAPTSTWSETIALALITTTYVQWVGVKEHGTKNYLKHLAGNPTGILGIVLIPLMLIINLSIEYLAVPLSLSLRLFANISSEDRLIYKFAELNVMFKGLPFFFQLFANILSVIFGFVQAFVFLLLSTVYISLILPHEEKHHETAPHRRGLSHSH